MRRIPFPVIETDLTEREFTNKLKKRRSMKVIGTGAFAVALGSKTGKTIVKIGSVAEDGMCGNSAYLRYLKKTMAYKSNPFFPKVKSVTVYYNKRNDEHYMVVEMERLIPLTTKQYGLAEVIEELFIHPSTTTAIGILLGGSKKAMETANQVHKVISYIHRFEDLDIHAGNVMMRKNGEVVITDPCC